MVRTLFATDRAVVVILFAIGRAMVRFHLCRLMCGYRRTRTIGFLVVRTSARHMDYGLRARFTTLVIDRAVVWPPFATSRCVVRTSFVFDRAVVRTLFAIGRHVVRISFAIGRAVVRSRFAIDRAVLRTSFRD